MYRTVGAQGLAPLQHPVLHRVENCYKPTRRFQAKESPFSTKVGSDHAAEPRRHPLRGERLNDSRLDSS
jgi:hypothetical protein